MGKTSNDLFLHRKGKGKVAQKKGDTTPQSMPYIQAQRRKVMVFEWCGCKRHGNFFNWCHKLYYIMHKNTKEERATLTTSVVHTSTKEEKATPWPLPYTRPIKEEGTTPWLVPSTKGEKKNKQKSCGAWQRFGFLLNSKDTCEL